MEKFEFGKSEKELTLLNDEELNKRLKLVRLHTWRALKELQQQLKKERELYPGELWDYGGSINDVRAAINEAMAEVLG